MRRLITLTAASAALVIAPVAAASAQSATTFTANITQANDSGASATANISLDGRTATVSIDGRNFFDGFPHAIHIHGEPGGNAVCGNLNLSAGSDLDADGDGIISVTESVPNYGPIAVSLTTEGDTSPDSGLAVDRFPTSSTLDYSRTFELPADVAEDLSDFHIVIHALDTTGSGEIGDSGIPSDLDPELDMEATAPAACGQIIAAAAGGVATGAGGTAADGTGTGAIALGAAGLAALGAVALRRRATVQA